MKNKIFTCILITLSHTFLFSQINIFIDARVEYKLVEVNVKEKENLKGQKMSGLDALIAKIEKSKKMSVLDKTKMDWKKVKDSNEEIDEELEMHRKSKNTYTEQQSFLQQAEYREYEKERDARLAANARRGPGI